MAKTVFQISDFMRTRTNVLVTEASDIEYGGGALITVVGPVIAEDFKLTNIERNLDGELLAWNFAPVVPSAITSVRIFND